MRYYVLKKEIVTPFKTYKQGTILSDGMWADIVGLQTTREDFARLVETDDRFKAFFDPMTVVNKKPVHQSEPAKQSQYEKYAISSA